MSCSSDTRRAVAIPGAAALVILLLAATCAIAAPDYGLVPAPRAIRTVAGPFRLPALTFSYSGPASPTSDYALEVLAKALGTGAARVAPTQAAIRLVPAPSPTMLAALAKQQGLPSAPPDRLGEAFVLDCGVSAKAAVTLTGGPSGLIYGAYALTQLLGRGEARALPRVAISDWPAMLTRAWTGVPRDVKSPSGLSLLDWFARWRINACYYEIYGDAGQDAVPPEVADIHRECARRGIALYGQISDWRTERLLKRELCASNPDDVAHIRRYSQEFLDRGCDGLIFLFDDLTQQAVEHPLTCPLCKPRFGNLAAAQLELIRPMVEVARQRGVSRLIVCPTPYYRGWQNSYNGKLDGREYFSVWHSSPLMEGVQVYHCLLDPQELGEVAQAGLRNFIYWYNGNRDYEACTPGTQRVPGLWGGFTEMAFGWYGYRWDTAQGLQPLPGTYDAFRHLPKLTQHGWLCGGGDYAFALWGAYCWDAERFDPRQAQRDILTSTYGNSAADDYLAWEKIIRKWYPRLLSPPTGLPAEAREAYVQEMKGDGGIASDAAAAFHVHQTSADKDGVGDRMKTSADTLAQTAANAHDGKCLVHLEDWTEQTLTAGKVRERRMDLSDFWSRYSLRYSQTTDADGQKHRTQWHFGSGLGMTGPSYRNWYDAGFMDVLVGGQSLDSAMPEFTKGSGPAGETLEGVWNTASGPLKIVFSLAQGGLKLEVKWLGGADVPLAVRLFAIPSAGNWPDMDRYVTTAAGETPHGTPVSLKAPDNWLFFADRTYDVPHENAEGPCAVAFVDRAPAIRCDNGSYVVQTDAEYPPQTRQFSLIVWDFHGQRNAAALAAFRKLGY